MAESPLTGIKTFQASDGYTWRYRRYEPSDRARAHLVCLHGIQSHGGWYEYSSTKLSQSGFRVDFLDRRGSGLNEQDRGDAPTYRRLVDDIAEYLASQRRPSTAQPGLPFFLVAISWGGKLALAMQRRCPELVNGLVLITPGLFARVRPSLRERLAIARSRIIAPGRRFPIPLSDAELFTATPSWQQYIRDDLLGLRQASARLLVESFRLDRLLRSVPRHVKVPVLLLLAEKDAIIDNAKTRRLVEQFATDDQEIIEYAGAHHTLEFEPDPDIYIKDVEQWLERHLASV